jgi:LPXTG-site transpeptidase (sortase) family protein
MRRRNPTTHSLTALAAAMSTIVFGVWVMTFGIVPQVAAPTVERVRAEVVPTPKPKVKKEVAPIAVAAGGPSTECPEMNNPGGRLNWGPTPNAQPAPTNGFVALPRLGVHAPIVKVGIDGERKMVVPRNARDVAWLDRGGIPGYTNNVLLAGHISYSRVAGSFGRIGELKKGDEIRLDIGGKKLRYRVIWNCLFSRNTERAEQIMGYTEKPSVTLISCGGGWDAAARTHSGRIAVRAEKISEPSPLKLKRSDGGAKPTPTARPLLDF